ncbi:MAG TPA: hypothetical protein ENF87_00035 [Thermoproteales archaeon]|nr:hypothetical protein [Thermoproteales archaeon]
MEEDKISGLLFVALMFLGAGIGLIFDRPDVGGTIGMGLGFIVMAYVKAKGIRVKAGKSVAIGSFTGSIIMSLIGLLFIVIGVSSLLGINIPWRIIGSLFMIALGLFFIALALGIFKVKE